MLIPQPFQEDSLAELTLAANAMTTNINQPHKVRLKCYANQVTCNKNQCKLIADTEHMTMFYSLKCHGFRIVLPICLYKISSTNQIGQAAR